MHSSPIGVVGEGVVWIGGESGPNRVQVLNNLVSGPNNKVVLKKKKDLFQQELDIVGMSS